MAESHGSDNAWAMDVGIYCEQPRPWSCTSAKGLKAPIGLQTLFPVRHPCGCAASLSGL